MGWRLVERLCIFAAGVLLGMIVQIEVEIKHTPNYSAIEAEQRRQGVRVQRG